MRYLLVTLAILAPLPAAAQSIGTSLSGPTSADGAAAYYNPAAMGAGRGTRLELVGGLLPIGVEYAPDDPRGLPASQTSGIAPIVSLGGYTDALDPAWRIGLTAGIVRVSGGTWPRDGLAGPITRYYLVDGSTFHVGITPALSYTPVEWITIGLGANVVYGNLSGELDKDFGSQLNMTVGSTDLNSPFPYGHPDLAAPITLSGAGAGVGAIGGVLVRPIPELTFGASVHSPVIVLGSGSLDVTYPDRLRQAVEDTLPGAELPELAAEIEMDLDIPTIFMFGVGVRPIPELEIATYYQYENLASQQNFYTRVAERTSESISDTAKPQAFYDRHRAFLRVGVLPIPELQIAAHGVFQSNTVPDETTAPNNIDFHRLEIGLAVQWRIVPEFSVLAQYSHLFLFERTITNSLHMPVTQPSLAAFNHPSPTGRYSGSADTIRLGLVLHFDADESAAAAEDEGAEPEGQQPEAAPAPAFGPRRAAPAPAGEGEAEAP